MVYFMLGFVQTGIFQLGCCQNKADRTTGVGHLLESGDCSIC